MELLVFRVDLHLQVLVSLVTGDRDDDLVLNVTILSVDNEEVSFDTHALLEVLTVNLRSSRRIQIGDSILRNDRNNSTLVDEHVNSLLLGIEVSP
jgi:hypothetical protein